MVMRDLVVDVLAWVLTVSVVITQHASTTHAEEVCRRRLTLKIFASSSNQRINYDNHKVYPGGIILKTEDVGDSLRLSFDGLDSKDESISVYEGVSVNGKLLRSINGSVGRTKSFLTSSKVFIDYDWSGSNINFIVLCRSMEPDSSPSFPSWGWIVIFVFIAVMVVLFRVLALYCRRRGLNNDRLSRLDGHDNVTSPTYGETELTGGRTPAINAVSLNVPPRNIDGAVIVEPPPPYSFYTVQNDNRDANVPTHEKPPPYSELDMKKS